MNNQLPYRPKASGPVTCSRPTGVSKDTQRGREKKEKDKKKEREREALKAESSKRRCRGDEEGHPQGRAVERPADKERGVGLHEGYLPMATIEEKKAIAATTF
ncbi:hypothetical protein V491_00849 [Pseudogymnoascus sp. VKM F-3775]|nr:hypothetical protein V491_00849 [Pseudogymnoascus sp. VKM F-3775]